MKLFFESTPPRNHKVDINICGKSMVIQFLYIVASILNFRFLEIVPTLFREADGQILLCISCIRQINHKTNLRKQRSVITIYDPTKWQAFCLKKITNF